MHSNVIVHSDNLVRVSESDALKHFWDIESINILDDTQFQAEENNFVERLQFNHGHYEVYLLWRENGPPISDHFNLCLNRL